MILPAYGLMGLTTQGLMGHAVLWGTDLGSPRALSGIFLSAYLLPAAATNFLGGWLGDRFGKRRIIVIAYAFSTVLFIVGWIMVKSPATLLVFAILQGLAFGLSTGPGLWTAYAGDIFGRASIGRLFGIMTVSYGVTGGLGPVLWGVIRESQGSYNPACLVTAGVYALMIVFTVLANPPKRRPH